MTTLVATPPLPFVAVMPSHSQGGGKKRTTILIPIYSANFDMARKVGEEGAVVSRPAFRVTPLQYPRGGDVQP